METTIRWKHWFLHSRIGIDLEVGEISLSPGGAHLKFRKKDPFFHRKNAPGSLLFRTELTSERDMEMATEVAVAILREFQDHGGSTMEWSISNGIAKFKDLMQ